MSVIMKKTYKYAIYCLAVLLLIYVVGTILWSNIRTSQSHLMNCIASARTVNNGIDVRLSIRVRLSQTNHGVMAFDGTLQDSEGKIYHIARQIKFSYRKSAGSAIVVRDVKINKTVADNVPEVLFSTMVWDETREEIKLYIKQLNNGYVFFNYFSPMMICVNKQGL